MLVFAYICLYIEITLGELFSLELLTILLRACGYLKDGVFRAQRSVKTQLGILADARVFLSVQAASAFQADAYTFTSHQP